MPLFQPKILSQAKQDESLIATRWAKFQNFLAKSDAIKRFYLDLVDYFFDDEHLHFSMVEDAMSRNQLFLDILRGNK